MVKLQELILKNNEIQHIPARFFAHMQQLKVLDLSNNKLDEFLKPSVFKTLPAHLSSLDISSEYTFNICTTIKICLQTIQLRAQLSFEKCDQSYTGTFTRCFINFVSKKDPC